MRVTDDQLEHWRTYGYVVVENFLSADEVAAALDEVAAYYPTWEEYAAARPRYRHLRERGGGARFPYQGGALSMISVHPDLIDFAERALGVRDVFLTQSGVSAKYAGTRDFDQPLHFDYGNNSLLVPRPEGRWHQTGTIIYLNGVDLDHGPTYVSPGSWRGEALHWSQQRPDWPTSRTAEEIPEQYEQQVPVTGGPGAALLYSQNTLHRGSKFLATEGVRFAQHLVYRAAGNEWMGFTAFPRDGHDPAMATFMVSATPRQREAIGVPGPGHPYWTEETISGVAARYPGMDMKPYRLALEGVVS